MNVYNFKHDFAHTTGYVDEDLDMELPDPYVAMHFKKSVLVQSCSLEHLSQLEHSSFSQHVDLRSLKKIILSTTEKNMQQLLLSLNSRRWP